MVRWVKEHLLSWLMSHSSAASHRCREPPSFVGAPIETQIGGEEENRMSVMSACDRLRELRQERRLVLLVETDSHNIK